MLLTICPPVTQAKGLFDEGNDMFGEEDSPGVDIFNKAEGAPKLVNIFCVYMDLIFAIFVSPLVPTFLSDCASYCFLWWRQL